MNLQNPKNRIAFTTLALFFLSFIALIWQIQIPSIYCFDEQVYVPAARAILAGDFSKVPEHPMLGKYLIALGIKLFGDTPFGWRIMSVIFSAITLCGIYLWGIALFWTTPDKKNKGKNLPEITPAEKGASVAVAITLVNQLFYVQSRVGMLEPFLTCFEILGFLFLAILVNPHLDVTLRKRSALGMTLTFALAASTKLLAFLPGLAIFCTLLIFRKKIRPVLQIRKIILIVLGFTGLSFFLSYLPVLFAYPDWGGISGLLDLQWRALQAHSEASSSHPYSSAWWQWPWMTHPIWYAAEFEANRTAAHFILFVGNLFIFWPGLLSVLACLRNGFKKESASSLQIALAFCVCYFSWAFIPKNLAFLYYYYLPSLIISLALAQNFVNWAETNWNLKAKITLLAFFGISLLNFTYFFPLLSAQRVLASEYPRWMWFDSWKLKTQDGGTEATKTIVTPKH